MSALPKYFRLNHEAFRGLTFGADGGTSGAASDLYFSAGPNDESHGLFGVIQPLNKRSGDDDNEGRRVGHYRLRN